MPFYSAGHEHEAYEDQPKQESHSRDAVNDRGGIPPYELHGYAYYGGQRCNFIQRNAGFPLLSCRDYESQAGKSKPYFPSQPTCGGNGLSRGAYGLGIRAALSSN